MDQGVFLFTDASVEYPTMLTHPNIDPVAISLGPVAIHWYGLTYLIGFAGAWWLGTRRINKAYGWTREELTDFIFYGALGAILGGRMGYMLIYGWERWSENPLLIFRIWEGGMSFHGGLIGVMIAFWLFARATNRTWMQVGDFVAPGVFVPIFTVRIGNFINGELWGRVTDVPWGMVFRGAGPDPRHPSQLYEAGLEGLALGLILWWYSSKARPRGAVMAMFGLLYATARFIVEFAREPDAHMGYVAFNWMTTGQVLSIIMALASIAVLVWAYTRPNPPMSMKEN